MGHLRGAGAAGPEVAVGRINCWVGDTAGRGARQRAEAIVFRGGLRGSGHLRHNCSITTTCVRLNINYWGRPCAGGRRRFHGGREASLAFVGETGVEDGAEQEVWLPGPGGAPRLRVLRAVCLPWGAAVRFSFRGR